MLHFHQFILRSRQAAELWPPIGARARAGGEGHPRDRLREEEVDAEVRALFDKLIQPEPVRAWFRETLIASTTHQQEQLRARCAELQRQLDEVRRQQERLLNLHLGGSIDEAAFAAKNIEPRDLVATLTEQLQVHDRRKDEKADLALRVFELSRSIPQKWDAADCSEKRRILKWSV